MAEEKQHRGVFHHHNSEEKPADYIKEKKHHKNLEHVGELGTAGAGAFAMNEKHKSKKDPENAHRHKIEEEIAAAAAVGTGGFVFHEHHEKKATKKEEEEGNGKKHHHF
ncbi:hypothetical protein POTOM_021703 [Populus tomentosa]|uniref:Uncharacterized protein n=1 Tax=Populus tomentosa TaxID=118781 RepID=A0A8X8D1I6_POPTO|nr:hypothetical protein POTOM_021703 [Populus tomentosa]